MVDWLKPITLRTNLSCLNDFVVLERIEVILDVYWRSFDWSRPEEWICSRGRLKGSVRLGYNHRKKYTRDRKT
jgi:hypothetical protein